jgi:hypothetical protein
VLLSHHPREETVAHPSGLTQDQIDDLEAQFCTQQTIVNLCCIPSGLAFLFLTHACLIAISQHLIQSDGVPGYHIAYQPVFYWFLPGFGALSLCFEITLQIWAMFVGHTVVNLYSEWDSRQPKRSRGGIVYYDVRKILRWFTVLLVIPIGILSSLALNMHTTFGEDGMHEFGYAFAMPKVHSYAQIRQVAHVHGVFGKHGRFIDRPYCVVDFADGHRWNQNDWDDSSASTARAIEAVLAAQTHLPFVDILVLEDLPTSNGRR